MNTMPEAPPIVCTLTEPQLRERRAGLLRRVREQIVAVRPALPAGASAEHPPGAAASDGPATADRPAGIELQFAADEATVADLFELVRLESRCCAFLRFRVTLEPAGGPVLLEVSGPPAGVELLAAELAPLSGAT
jgi:hypothetical protein